jgi:hypothetical protein
LYRRAGDSSTSRFIRRPSITAILGIGVFVTLTDGNQRCIVGDASISRRRFSSAAPII